MKLKWIIPLLITACAACASAFADVWNGSVAAATEVEIVIPADGTLDTFDLTVGQTVSTGDVVGHIRETKVFSRVYAVKYVERRCLRFAKDAQRIARNFHCSCLKIRICSAFSLSHSPCDRDAILAVQRCCLLISFKDDLHDAGAVSQINKDDTALIAALCDPTHECHLFSDHILCDLAAPCCAYETLH